ncbi:MAG: uroporphyrinogen decarboxylase family protein [Clostridia bacterium]|jgi:hypothetical protein
MISKTVIKKVLEFDNPGRIGYDFLDGSFRDMKYVELNLPKKEEYKWQKPEYFKDMYPKYRNFDGFLHLDEYNNLWGRMTHDTTGGGEVLEGGLKSWDDLKFYKLPDIDDEKRFEKAHLSVEPYKERFILGSLPGCTFAIMRYIRKMEIFLADLVLEEENVLNLQDLVINKLVNMVEMYGSMKCVDAIFFCEDWGTQDRLLISPAMWRKIFKPAYTKLCDSAHKNNLKVIMHSCGYIYEILDDLLDAGIDAFQLDQPTLMGIEKLADKISKKATLFSPVDIQAILPTGNKEFIEKGAQQMVDLFYKNGGLIAKDYGDYNTLHIKDEWAGWARNKFFEIGGQDPRKK